MLDVNNVSPEEARVLNIFGVESAFELTTSLHFVGGASGLRIMAPVSLACGGDNPFDTKLRDSAG